VDLSSTQAIIQEVSDLIVIIVFFSLLPTTSTAIALHNSLATHARLR